MDLAVEILNNKEKWIKCIVSKFGLSRGNADDYLSECVLKLLERKKTSIKIKNNDGYIYVLIRNLIKSSYLHRREPPILYTDDLLDYDKKLQNINNTYPYKEFKNEIYKLKYIHKECLILKFRFGLNQYEISRFLNVNKSTITTRIIKGQAELKQEILNNYEFKQLKNINYNCSYREIRDEIYNLRYIFKECLILRFGFGLTHKEIIKFLDISGGTIAARIMRGQAMLKCEILNNHAQRVV